MFASLRHTTSLRVRLLLLALAASLPVTLFAVFVVMQMAADRREHDLGELIRHTAAVTALVDQALYGTSRELTTLAVDKDLQEDDLGGAYREAVAFVAQSNIGESISLLRPDGSIVFNTRRPLGAVLPPSGDLDGVHAVVETRTLRISNLFTGAIDGRPILTVDMPVLRDGAVIYVLHMVIDPKRVLHLLHNQALERDWVVAVLDRAGNFIARTRDPEGSLGRPANDVLRRAMDENRETPFAFTMMEGDQVIGALRRTSMGNLGVALAVPRGRIDIQTTRFLLLLLGGAVLILGLATWTTIRLATRLERRLLEVGVLAGRLGAGQAIVPVQTGITELDAVGRSLARAATLISSREAALTRAGKVARDALASKAKFFAAANHDLRQPVQSLFLFHATMASLLPPDHPARRPLDYSERSLHALEMLLDGLRDVSRLDAGAVVPVVAPMALNDMLQSLGNEYRLRAAEHGVTLRVVATSAWVNSDRALLDRVLRNLIENAIRYTPRGGRMLLGCRHRGGHVRVQVVDTGIGIPADQQGSIFEEFLQLGNPARDSALGLGLGLAIVRRICDLMGHGISVASAVGKGSAFTVHMPRCQKGED